MPDPFRIGILGGMGPEAGVLLQSLIIAATPARADQDHLEVITFTNPHVPDRTASLQQDGGESYLRAVVDSLLVLERAGVSVLVMACNTAYARLPEIQRHVKTPMVNIVELAKQEIAAAEGRAGILATDGTVRNGLFALAGAPDKIITPGDARQREVMAAIYAIKGGEKAAVAASRLDGAIADLRGAGCGRIILGCTELSLCHDDLTTRHGAIFIDPMQLAAMELVRLARGSGVPDDGAPAAIATEAVQH